MRYAEILLILILLCEGCYCAVTDLRYGIVLNRAITIGFLAGLIPHFLIIIMDGIEYYQAWLIDMVIADIIAFGMYFGKYWAAGDAKLFMLLYYCVPPRILDYGELSAGIIPYIFIFVPALGWMVADSTIRLVRKEPRKEQKVMIRDLLIRCSFVMIEGTTFYALCSIIFAGFFREQPMTASAMLLIYSLICGTVDAMRKGSVMLIHFMVLCGLWIIGSWKPTLPTWEHYGLVLLALSLQRYCAMYNYQLIPTADVRKGMILASESVLQFRKSRVHFLPQDFSEELSAKISEKEADAVHRWGRTSQGMQQIWIVRKVPFALMISIGFVLWIIGRLMWR